MKKLIIEYKVCLVIQHLFWIQNKLNVFLQLKSEFTESIFAIQGQQPKVVSTPECLVFLNDDRITSRPHIQNLCVFWNIQQCCTFWHGLRF